MDFKKFWRSVSRLGDWVLAPRVLIGGSGGSFLGVAFVETPRVLLIGGSGGNSGEVWIGCGVGDLACGCGVGVG